MRPLLTVLLAAPLALSACASLQTAGEPTFQESAEQVLAQGVEALEDGNFIDAEKYFEHVRTKYPFLAAAKDAELYLADVHFARERFLEARDRYQNFVKLNPTHARVDYAAFRAALTHYKEIPSDFFLLPSPSEKDQGEVRNAARAMQNFIRDYPQSQHQAEAKEILADARKRLVEHELYVADFYAKREKWKAVAGRLEKIVTDLPGTEYDERAWFELVDAYRKLEDAEAAKKTLERIIQRLPGSPAAERAKSQLGS